MGFIRKTKFAHKMGPQLKLNSEFPINFMNMVRGVRETYPLHVMHAHATSHNAPCNPKISDPWKYVG